MSNQEDMASRSQPCTDASALALSVPAGWKLVPIEPTTEMHHAASRGARFLDTASDIYKRMVAASPRAPAAAPLRPEVLAFAVLMEKQLQANDHKPGWKKDPWSALLNRLREETQQLDDRLTHAAFADYSDRGARVFHDPVEIAAERTAHVANFAMMIADVCGALSPALEASTLQSKGG